MRRSPRHLTIRSASTLALAFFGMSSMSGMTAVDDVFGAAENAVRDSIEVNGARFVYLADVSIDTTQGEVLSSFSDWWIGVGWDVRRNHQVMGTMSTLDLVSNRPQLMLEHHLTLPRMGGRLGWNVVYSQPWRLAQEEVSDNAKGWIAEPGSGWPLPVRQVILSPDSLFPEPDTLLAPLSIGNAIRIGGFWEGQKRLGWHPRLGMSFSLWRPQNWLLHQPGPTFESWQTVNASDTFEAGSWWNGRWRIDAGGTLDLGQRHPGVRAATQCRMLAYWVPGRHWGVNLSLAVSPTRR